VVRARNGDCTARNAAERRCHSIDGPAFIATKFEAFLGRGKGDVLASHDLEDIVDVIASRAQLPQEIARSPEELRAYLAHQSRELLAIPDFVNYLPGLILNTSSPRLTDEVLECIGAIAQSGP